MTSKVLGIFDNIPKEAAITDFSILLGGFVSDYTLNGSEDLEDRIGWYWTKTHNGNTDARAVDSRGSSNWGIVYRRSSGCRPALSFSSISSIATNEVSRPDGSIIVECGEYPQDVVDLQTQTTLEVLYKYNSTLFKITGRKYTTDSRKYTEYSEKFKAQTLTEYEYEGRKFVRVVANTCYDGENVVMSTGDSYKDGDAVWVEVKPIKWLVDKKADIAFTEKLIFAGVQFKNTRDYKGDFDKTDVKEFMDKYFSKEIVQERVYVEEKNNSDAPIENSKTKKKINPYDLIFENVSEEDIIKGCVISGITPYLHGKSSEGKSARVKQLDKDCEIIYLRTATPDSLNGKSVYNQATGEMIDIPPSWYKRLKEKCEKEPDKLHILFLDELANALPAIQSMAFNLILDKEVDGKWNLPENARIVAAGNEVSDSISANELAEPLFNRLAHVYINTTVEDWLKWASNPDSEYEKLDLEESKIEAKIHPAIFAFISYKRDKALRTEYNGKTPNADPRKWEMASKVLYQTKNPNMLRALIGQELTLEFIHFCNQKVITLEDVISGNYTDQDLNMNPAEKYAIIVSLSYVKEENLEIVRNFVINNLEQEYLALFDSLWTHGDSLRLEKILELRMKGGLKK